MTAYSEKKYTGVRFRKILGYYWNICLGVNSQPFSDKWVNIRKGHANVKMHS